LKREPSTLTFILYGKLFELEDAQLITIDHRHGRNHVFADFLSYQALVARLTRQACRALEGMVPGQYVAVAGRARVLPCRTLEPGEGVEKKK
jgi:hypothetical protein